jgi:hypothetical protein
MKSKLFYLLVACGLTSKMALADGSALKLYINRTDGETTILKSTSDTYVVLSGPPNTTVLTHCEMVNNSPCDEKIFFYRSDLSTGALGATDMMNSKINSSAPGDYIVWVSTPDGKIESNRVRVHILPDSKISAPPSGANNPQSVSTAIVPSSSRQARAAIKLTINGKESETVHLGNKYEIEITGAPPGANLVGMCVGASQCDFWFLGKLEFPDFKTDRQGKVTFPAWHTSNANIPQTTYTLSVKTKDGSFISNKVALTIASPTGH